jgi:hypothetical protein
MRTFAHRPEDADAGTDTFTRDAYIGSGMTKPDDRESANGHFRTLDYEYICLPVCQSPFVLSTAIHALGIPHTSQQDG